MRFSINAFLYRFSTHIKKKLFEKRRIYFFVILLLKAAKLRENKRLSRRFSQENMLL